MVCMLRMLFLMIAMESLFVFIPSGECSAESFHLYKFNFNGQMECAGTFYLSPWAFDKTGAFHRTICLI
jgi:hypothetical protein